MPPKKQKKPPNNAYYFFMQERKAELEAEGYRFPRGMHDVNSAVYAEWRVLPGAERARYDELAREAKENEKTNFKNKFTTTGESYESLFRRQEAEQAEKAELRALFQRVVHTDIPEERIYVVMRGIPSCEVGLDNLTESKQYYPLELAAAAFSLKDGYICGYWTLINTMSVPCGYASSAKDTSEETCLPQPGSELFQRVAPDAHDYNKIMNHVRQFLETWCSDYPDKKIMVFAMDNNIKCLKGNLDWLVKHADENKDLNESFLKNVKFYSLPSLVIELAVLAHQINPEYDSELQQFRLVPSAEALLSNGCYDYREEITCSFHNKEEFCRKMHICCKNYILRRIFIILEQFSEAYSCHLTDRHKVNAFFNTRLPDHLRDRLPRAKKDNNSPVSNPPVVEEDDQKPTHSASRSSSHNAAVWAPLGFENNVREDKKEPLNDQRSESHMLANYTVERPESPVSTVSQTSSSKGRGRGLWRHDSSGEIQQREEQFRIKEEKPTSPPATFRPFGRGHRGPTFAEW